jgi:hypothetical protein
VTVSVTLIAVAPSIRLRNSGPLPLDGVALPPVVLIVQA